MLSHETHGEVADKEQSQLSLAPTLLFMLQVKQMLQKRAPDEDIGVTIDQLISVFYARRPEALGHHIPLPCVVSQSLG